MKLLGIKLYSQGKAVNKILKPGWYPFGAYKSPEFGGYVEREIDIPDEVQDIYTLPESGPEISVSAIVGKNGSGKSSLLEDPMGRSKYKFLTSLTSDSVADRWVRSLMDEKNLKRLLIGDWDDMAALKDELERIEPDFRLLISMAKHSIRKATADTQVEDLNRILSEIFVNKIYNSKEGIFDKAEFVRLKGMKVCPLLRSAIPEAISRC